MSWFLGLLLMPWFQWRDICLCLPGKVRQHEIKLEFEVSWACFFLLLFFLCFFLSSHPSFFPSFLMFVVFVCKYTTSMQKTMGVRRERWILGIRVTDSCVWVAMWVLGSKPWSSARAAKEPLKPLSSPADLFYYPIQDTPPGWYDLPISWS